MKSIKIIYFLCISVFTGPLLAQQTPAEKQNQAVTIVGATAHIGNGEVIENSLIIFDEGKLTTVAEATSTKKQYPGTVIYAEGKHVYPGFIAPNTSLGLVEIDAIRQSDDEDEIGEMIPHIRSIVAYNAESVVVESMRPNGVLLGQIAPRGGRISGTSSIVQFDAWNWEDALLKENDGLHINWPNSVRRGRWWAGEDPGVKPNDGYSDEVGELKEFFENANAYLAGPREKTNLPFEALETVFSGEKTVYIHADGEKEIVDIINFKKEHNIDKLVLVGAYNAYKVADLIKENEISVLVGRLHSSPNLDDDDYDLPYKMAKLLHDKGVLVALENSGDMERMNARNLPFFAGTAVAHGMDKEEALKLITSNAAKILGIDTFTGTLEVGKDATLFISEGDALDMRTNKLSKAFIQGRDISLGNYQGNLAKRYQEKLSQ